MTSGYGQRAAILFLSFPRTGTGVWDLMGTKGKLVYTYYVVTNYSNGIGSQQRKYQSDLQEILY